MQGKRVAWSLSVLLAIELAALIWLCHDYYPVGYYNDDAALLEQARHFVATGHLYEAPWDPLDGLTWHPPGQALVLSPVAWLVPGSDVALRVFATLMTIVSAVLLAVWAYPTLGWAGGALLATVFVVNGPSATHGSTLMADVSFGTLTLATLLYAERRLRDATSSVLVGLVIGFTMLVRVTAGVTLAAIGVNLLIQRRPKLILPAGLAAGAVFMLSKAGGYTAYQQVAVASGDLSRPLLYFKDWSLALADILGHHFLQIGLWVVPLLLVAALVSGVRSPGPLVPIFVLLYLGLLVSWPYPSPRYFLIWWPLLLGVICRPLPRRAAWAVLGVALLGSLPGLWTAIGNSLQVPERTLARHDAEDWLRVHSDPHDTVMASLPFDAFYHTRRRVYGATESPFLSQYTWHVAIDNPTYCLVDRINWSHTDVAGTPQVLQLPHLTDWLDHSTLYRRLYASPWQSVYRMVLPRGRFLIAWHHFRAAVQLAGEAQERELEATLAVVPDFPEARSLLAATWLSRNSHRAEAMALLQTEVHQYPLDYPAAVNLALALDQAGQHAESIRTLQAAAQTAAAAGDRDALTQLQTMLDATPPTKKRAQRPIGR